MSQRRAFTLVWATAVIACGVWGYVHGLHPNGQDLPHRFGLTMVALCLIAGVVFGVRGVALEAVGSIAFGLARLIGYDNPGGEDQSDLVVALFFLWAPVVFAVPVLLGAFARWLTTGRGRSTPSW